jgi:hypothetical protein
MVGVFDFRTGLNGVIDPTSFAFAPQNADRSYFELNNGINPAVGAPRNIDLGPPVYTQGNIISQGYISSASYINSGSYIQSVGYISSGSYINATTNINAGSNINATGNISTGSYISAAGQIRSIGPNNARIDVNLAGTGGTYEIDTSVASFYYLNNIDTDITLNVKNSVFGDKLYLQLTVANGVVVTFGSTFGVSVLNSGLKTLTGTGALWIMSFINDKFHMIELTRGITYT